MKAIQTHARYVEWLNAEDMHKASQDWLSELLFIADEHLFLSGLITSFTLQLIKPETFSGNKEIIDSLNRSQRRNKLLIKSVKKHESNLKIMVDGIDQPKEEEAYKDEHRELIVTIGDFLKDYKTLKTQLFDIIKTIRKTEKLERLIDRR